MISFSDEVLREIAKVFSGKRIHRHDLVNLFFCSLADTPYFINTRRFKLGFLSYLPALFLKRWGVRGRLPDPAIHESFDHMVCILGDVGKEQDTLVPVISSLRERNTKVLVVWLRASPISADTMAEIQDATVFIPSASGEMCGSLAGFLQDLGHSFSILLKGCYFLRNIGGWSTAFSQRGAWLFEQIFYLLRWERYFSNLLSKQHLQGVAIVSETAVCTQAVCHVAVEHRWPTHHFLHGMPGLLHTRSLSDDIYCFSSIERNYFLRNGWSPESVHAKGHPRQYRFSRKIQKLRTTDPNVGGIRILFASQPSIDGMGFYADEYTAIHEAVIGSAKRLGLGPQNIRVRLHPIEDDKRFLEIAGLHGLDSASDLLSKGPIEEDLAWANVVITIASTVSVEAAYSGCALIWLRFGKFHYEVREELCDEGFGLSVSSEDELHDELERLQNPEYRSTRIAEFLEAARRLSVIVPAHHDFLPDPI
ncbi:MAG: hypothetical protein V4689_14370 [Verrucomicrobiota bacterium]